MTASRNLARLRRMAKGLLGSRRFRSELRAFVAPRTARRLRLSGDWGERFPCVADRTATTGFDRHCICRTAWAARVLAATRPARHVNIGSSLYFAALASTFMPIKFYDVRPADLDLDGLRCGAANLRRLPFADRSIESLSCMHVLEHVGLGRCGDSVDPDGELRAAEELGGVLAAGGQAAASRRARREAARPLQRAPDLFLREGARDVFLPATEGVSARARRSAGRRASSRGGGGGGRTSGLRLRLFPVCAAVRRRIAGRSGRDVA